MQCVQTNGALGCAHVQGIHKSRKLKKRLVSLAKKLVQKAKCLRKRELVYILDNSIVCTGALKTRRDLPFFGSPCQDACSTVWVTCGVYYGAFFLQACVMCRAQAEEYSQCSWTDSGRSADLVGCQETVELLTVPRKTGPVWVWQYRHSDVALSSAQLQNKTKMTFAKNLQRVY